MFADGAVIGPKIKKSKKSLGGSIYDKCAETVRDLLYEMDSVNASKLMVCAYIEHTYEHNNLAHNQHRRRRGAHWIHERARSQTDRFRDHRHW